MKDCQDDTEQVHILWPIKFCIKTGENIYSLIGEYLQENMTKGDHRNNIMVQSSKRDIILDCCIMTCDDQQPELNSFKKLAMKVPSSPRKILMTYKPSYVITHATTKAMGIHLTGTFRPCKDCAIGNEKMGCIGKKDVVRSKILRERLFFDINSPFTPTGGGKKH